MTLRDTLDAVDDWHAARVAGVRADGWREVLGFAVGESETDPFRVESLRTPRAPAGGLG